MNIGIIGTGGRSVPYTVIPGTGVLGEDVKVTALCRRDMGKLEEYARKYFDEGSMPRLYTDYNEMLDDGEIDAVVICTPDATHKEIGTAALRKGKHILLEKPFATTLDDCIELYNESIRHNRVIRLGFVLRFSGVYKKIKEIVSSGVLGDIITVEAREMLSFVHAGSYFRRWNRFAKVSGGLLNAKCSHDMDILNWLIGAEPVYVSSFGSRSYFNPIQGAAERCRDCKISNDCKFDFYKFKKRYGDFNTFDDLCVFNVDKDLVDHQVVNIEYENKVTASYTVTMLSADAGRRINIFGTEATLQASFSHENDDDNYISVKHIHPKKEEIYRFSTRHHDDCDRIIYEGFIKAIRSGRYVEESDARAGLLSSGIALAAEISMHDRKVVNLQDVIKAKTGAV